MSHNYHDQDKNISLGLPMVRAKEEIQIFKGFYFFNFIEIQLIYNVALITDVQ